MKFKVGNFKTWNRDRLLPLLNKNDQCKQIYKEYLDGIARSKRLVQYQFTFDEFMKADNHDWDVLSRKIADYEYFNEIIPSYDTEIILENILNNDINELK